MAKRKKSRATGPRLYGTRRASDQVTPRPELARQLEARDLIVFWRDGAMAGRRSGLALTIDSCPSPECECRGVKLDGLMVTDDVALIESTRDALRITQWSGGPLAPKGKVVVEVDIETGEVEPLAEGSDPELVAWVTAEVDGELLERLHERWRIGKGKPGRSRIHRQLDVSGWKPGELLGFDEVFEAERHDRFVIGDSSYWVDTFLCPVPSCDCHLAEVAFSRAGVDEPSDVGCVRLALRSGEVEVIAEEAEAGQAGLLTELWHRFAKRHAVGTFLAGREARMRMAWPALEGALPAAASASLISGATAE